MSSQIPPEFAKAKADLEAVFAAIAQDVEAFEAEFTSREPRAVWREQLAWLTVHMIEKIRGHMRDLAAIAERCPTAEGAPVPSDALELEKVIFGPLTRGLISEMLLTLNSLLCLPCLVRPYEAQTAALIARNAAIEGDSDTVDAFSKNVFGLKHPARWREAVEMALLGDWVASLGTGTATKPHIHDLLRRHADLQHEYLSPVWERRIKGQRTTLLGRPVDETRTIADLLVDYRTPEQHLLSEERDVQVSAVLKHLSADEQALALAWAERGDSWPAVADELSHERKFGEKVRRKLRRLGDRHDERAAEAERTTRRMR
ncbi:hypothetical protein ACFXPZ_14075 [Streptomyces sp. NPDC059101]|uniref:hypothetical protein n=1 Tax=Streptomyces sp. NPDC059101 TaxID=3346728 RepID=UPI0036BD922D